MTIQGSGRLALDRLQGTVPAGQPARGTRSVPAVFCVLAGLVGALLLLMPAQNLTGDEQRYLLYAQP